MKFFRHSTLGRPSRPDPSGQGVSPDASAFRPFGQAHGLAKRGESVVRSLIAGLLRPGGPVAIPWLVIAVVVYAVNGVPFAWAFTHVGEEVCEGRFPLITDRYSSASVVAKKAEVFVAAPLNHGCPDAPCASLAAIDCVAMLSVDATRHLPCSAPTRCAIAVPEGAPRDRPFCCLVAGAPTDPVRLAVGNPVETQDGPPSKHLACEINSSRHCIRLCNERIAVEMGGGAGRGDHDFRLYGPSPTCDIVR